MFYNSLLQIWEIIAEDKWSAVIMTKINWKNLICQFQRHSRVPGNSRKIPGMMKFLNFVLKIKFLDIIWEGKVTYILNLVKPNQIQGIPGLLDVWIPGFKIQNLLPKVGKNIVIMIQVCSLFSFYQKLSFFENLLLFYVNLAIRKRQSQ